MSKILEEIKHEVGPSGDYEYYNVDITNAINEAFAVLYQLGVGPENGFKIESGEETWDDFTTEIPVQSLVKQYVLLKVRDSFDPPNSSFVLSNMKEKIREYEWRLNQECDPARRALRNESN